MSRPPLRTPHSLPEMASPSITPPLSSRPRPGSSSPLKRPTPGRGASTSETAFDIEKARQDNDRRLKERWDSLDRWERRMDQDDVVDLRSMEVIENRGVLESIARARDLGMDEGGNENHDRASVEDSDDELDLIPGYDRDDKPVDDDEDDNFSTTDDDEGSLEPQPLRDEIPKRLGLLSQLDVNNPQDAADLAAFLKDEKRRAAMHGDPDKGESQAEETDDDDETPQQIITLDDFPTTSSHGDTSSDDELDAIEEVLPPMKPSAALETPRAETSFKTRKLPSRTAKTLIPAMQLQTPPRSTSVSSREVDSLPSPSPSPILPRDKSSPLKLAKTTARPNASIRKATSTPKAPTFLERPQSSPSKKPCPQVQVELVRRPRPKSLVDSDDDSSPIASSPLKGKGVKRRPLYVVSDSEDDLVEPLVPMRKRKRSSTLQAPEVCNRKRSITRNFDSDQEVSLHPPPMTRSPKRHKYRVYSSTDPDDSPNRAGPSNHRPQRNYDSRVASPEHYPRSSSNHHSHSGAVAPDSEEEDYRYTRHQRSRSYLGSSYPISSDADSRHYQSAFSAQQTQELALELIHRLLVPGAGQFSPSYYAPPNPAFNTPTRRPHPYPYTYDPNLSRATLPPSSPEAHSSPNRENVAPRRPSLVARSKSRGRRVSFEFDETEVPRRDKGKRREDTPRHLQRHKMVTKDEEKSSCSESEAHSTRCGRTKDRGQTPGPAVSERRNAR